jgi:hypothetical protein
MTGGGGFRQAARLSGGYRAGCLRKASILPGERSLPTPVESVTGPKFHMDFKWEGSRLLSVASTFEDDRSLKGYKALADTAGGLLKQDEERQATSTSVTPAPIRFFRWSPSEQAASASSDIRILRGANGVVRVVLEPDRPRLLLRTTPRSTPTSCRSWRAPSPRASGSGVFNPFVWDGFHYFSLQYDREGRLSEAGSGMPTTSSASHGPASS